MWCRIECIIEISGERGQIPVTLDNIKIADDNTGQAFARLHRSLGQQLSQWFYLQRSLRLYDGLKIHVYKTPHLINWTRTEAMNDATDVIGQVLSSPPALVTP